MKKNSDEVLDTSSDKPRPITKWTGGKRQLLPALNSLKPKSFDDSTNKYFEPFVGGGAFLFDLMPTQAVINDWNSELINAYRAVRDAPQQLITKLKEHEDLNNNENYEKAKAHYLEVRAMDRGEKWKDIRNESRADVDRAARILYMLRVDFNGLYRVNSKNQFNVPYGRYKNPKIVDQKNILAVSNYFNSNNIEILNEDFEKAVSTAKQNDFVYFDPPYAPLVDTASFTSYTENGFGEEEQKRLAQLFSRLTDEGVKVMLSNSSVPLIHDLYESIPNAKIHVVGATRMINSDAKKRKDKVNEVIITNYEF